MRGRGSTTSAVSLFPFLAVLVCVMGALIFLLLATTKRLRDIAVAQTQPVTHESPPAPEPNSELEALARIASPTPNLGPATPPHSVAPPAPEPAESPEIAEERQRLAQEWQARIAQLERQRDDLRDALRKQRLLQDAANSKLAALQDSVGESETRLRGVLAQVETLEESLEANSDLAALEQQIAELRRKLRQLQNRPTEGKSKFAVIPFDVRSGTTRRPILIECTDDGLRFLPEDIVIKPSDLEGFTEQYNPLLAGANALMSYWTAWNMRQPQPEDKPEPYVLLMVRPNGTVAYYVAMRLLSSLKQPHGYELIDEDVELQPPPLDPAAQQACREAIEQLLAERAEVAQQVRNGFRGGAGGGSGGGAAPKGNAAAERKRSSDKFEISDVLSPGGEEVGERSWENIDRFEGRRPTKNSGHSDSTANVSPGRGSAGREAARAGAGSSTRPPNSPRPPRELPQVAERDGMERTGASERRGATERSATERSGAERSGAERNGGEPAEQSGAKPGTEANERGISRLEPVPDDPLPPAATDPNRPSGMTRQAFGRRHPQGKPKEIETSQLAQLGRRHWGKSEPGATIGIEQDVTVRVDSHQLLVADHYAVRYQPGEQSLDLFLRMMEAVDAEANTWGKPRPGFYWTPRLRFVISPGGNQAFERLDPLANRSGLSTTREFTLEGVSPTKSEVRP